MPSSTPRSAPAPLRRVARLAVGVVSAAGWIVVITGALLLLVPALLGLDRYVITGGSMAPAIDRGSVVFSRAVPVEDLRVGDVITYRPPADSGVDHLVTHRITSVDEGDDGRPVLTTKGDANGSADPWTFQLTADRQNVVEHEVPVLGHLVAFLADPSKRIVVIGVPAALIALQACRDLVRIALGRAEPDGLDDEPGSDPRSVAPTDDPWAALAAAAAALDDDRPLRGREDVLV